ncbi:SHOCT domain-containing protein [Kitasatospora saccharophila]|uniref:SHOCT domain-containing protein n=1 Tax=Kitasatospora saccharophila TaxID=407973 RepID=UPI003644171C
MDDTVVPDEPRWPGLSGGRWFGAGFFAVLVAAGGFGAARAQLSQPAAEGRVLAGLALFGAFLAFVCGQLVARGGGPDGGVPVFGAGTAVLAGAALGAGGAAAGGWGGRPLAVVALLAAAGAVPAARHSRRWWLADRAEQRAAALLERRIRTEGETVRGTVVRVDRISAEPNHEGCYWAVLTVRYQAGGVAHEAERPVSFPAHSRPRPGGTGTVRFLPGAPTDVRFELDDPDAPQDGADLPDRIGRLHRLHLDGALTAEEFALAKRRLLAGE